MKIPAPLKKGDKVGIVCTARAIEKGKIEFALEELKKWGLSPVVGESVGVRQDQFAGNDELRARDFQQMMDDPEIKAILCAKGGYGTVRILDQLDFTKFNEMPKWVTGFSDVTALHSHIHRNCNTATLHAPLLSTFKRNCDEALLSMREALFNQTAVHSSTNHKFNRTGVSEGILVGGNLSVIYSLLASNSDINTEGKILFLEDLDEYLYHIDRMIVALKRSGKLDKIVGLLIGGMTKMHDNDIPFGKDAFEIIKEHTAEFDYPICFNFQAGHIQHNRALLFGMNHRLTIDEKTTVLKKI